MKAWPCGNLEEFSNKEFLLAISTATKEYEGKIDEVTTPPKPTNAATCEACATILKIAQGMEKQLNSISTKLDSVEKHVDNIRKQNNAATS